MFDPEIMSKCLVLFTFLTAAGMKHLRENGIVHRDIKPGNILLYKKEDGK